MNYYRPPKQPAKKTVFGFDISPILNFQIPEPIAFIFDMIEKKALKTEGLFRIPGKDLVVSFFVHKINKHYQCPYEYEYEGMEKSGETEKKLKPSKKRKLDKIMKELDTKIDIYTVCTLLKKYFSSLPCPLLTYEYYDILISANAIPEPQRRLQVIRKILKTIPPSHFILLRRLCELLQRISQYGEENKMTVTNLAICFSPTLIRSENMKYTFQDLKVAHELLETFVSQLSFFFYEDDDDEGMPNAPGTRISSEKSALEAAAKSDQNLESCEVPITFEGTGIEITTCSPTENDERKKIEIDGAKDIDVDDENDSDDDEDIETTPGGGGFELPTSKKFEMSAEQLSRKSVVLQSNIDFFKTLIAQEGGALFLNNSKGSSSERASSPPPVGFSPNLNLASPQVFAQRPANPNLKKRPPPPPPNRRIFSIEIPKEMGFGNLINQAELQEIEQTNESSSSAASLQPTPQTSASSPNLTAMKKPPPPPVRRIMTNLTMDFENQQ